MRRKRKRSRTAEVEGVDAEEEEPPSDAEVLAAIAEEAELFHTPGGEGYASVPVRGHTENWPVRSKEFRLWLAHRFFQKQRRAPSTSLLLETLHQTEARAQFGAPEEEVFLRVSANGRRLSIDLCDGEWRALEVSAGGYRVVERPAVKFRRAPGMLAFPSPQTEGSLEDLRPFLNLCSSPGAEDDWYLLLAWLSASLRPRGPYPLLILSGEPGTAKSTTARVLRKLIDPNSVPLRRPPRDERDLMISANNSRLVCLDNLSRINPRLSDSLCCLSTGGGFATRRLFSDAQEALFVAQRPVLLTGIDDLAERGDLLDRSLILTLPPVPERSRIAEAKLWGDFEKGYSKLFGSVLDLLSASMRKLPRVKLRKSPRMADFARWGVAVERALGWPKGSFLSAYQRNLELANDQAIHSQSVGPAILQFVSSQAASRWTGTCGELLEGLARYAGEGERRDRQWPRSPQQLGRLLRRLGVNFRRAGFEVRFWREGKLSSRVISIRKVG